MNDRCSPDIELLPCPFCGGDVIAEGYVRDGRIVSCMKCHASVRAFQPNAVSHAIAKWNTRASIQPATPTACPTSDPSWPESQPCSICGAYGPWFDTPQIGECVEATGGDVVAATPPGRDVIARVLYECEKKRATNADAVIKGAFPNASNALQMEPWDDCKDAFLSDADAVLATLNVAQAASEPLTYDEKVEMLRLADDIAGGEISDMDQAQSEIVVRALRTTGALTSTEGK